MELVCGKWIKTKRLDTKFSQLKLAAIAGISVDKLAAWESGRRNMPANMEQVILDSIQKAQEQIDSGVVKVGRSRTKGHKSISPDVLLEPYCLKISAVPSIINSDLKVIDVFSGCGGMSLGAKWSGCNLVGHIEKEEFANKIYQANFPDSEHLASDITEITDQDIQSWKDKFGEITIMCGGTPCQTFSYLGKRDINDSRSSLYLNYLNIAKILQPKFIVMENVKALLTMKVENKGLVVDLVKEEFSRIGYHCRVQVLNANDYGVPQTRERAIFIGVRKDLSIDLGNLFPKRNHIRPTFRMAVKGLESLESGEWSKDDKLHWAINHPEYVLEWLRNVPEGGSAHDNEDPKLRPSSGFSSTYSRLWYDRPSSAITINFSVGGIRNVHPEQTRAITIREAMRCQSFPDDFKMFGRWCDMRTVIGNAVPPLLAKSITENLKSLLGM